VFVDSFSLTDFGPESMKSGCKPWIGFSSMLVLYEINREPRDVGGFVMSLED